MTSALRFLSFALLAVLTLTFQTASANNAAYEQRRVNYITTALANFDPDAITLQAYQGLPLDTGALNSMLRGASTNDVSDFDIVKLIRILYFTNGQYDSLILPVLNPIPFWLSAHERTRVYWSENHMSMWMSSDWLLHEKYGKTIDATLDQRLRHFLRLKVQYGFYEFFSSVYAPYCLTGLLNLADFAQDAEIKNLATLAAQRLMKEILMPANDLGVSYPTAGRNYYGKYDNIYGQNHTNVIYLLTGLGQVPTGASHAGGFLASSTIEVDSVINTWTPYMDTVYYHGHSVEDGLVINGSDSLSSFMDRVITRWSSGTYFHPLVAEETAKLLTDSDLWHHPEFTPFGALSIITPASIPETATELSCISESSVISGETIAMFKHKSITLSSVQDFWKGKLGYQEFPCVANVGTTAVMTASGPVTNNWGSRSANNANEDLPYVCQHKNVALLMYRPEPIPPSLGFNHKQVALHWMNAEFDEQTTDSVWLIGRQNNSYVAVRRNCTGEIDSVIACDIPNGQSWVIVVGDSDMYGNYSNFKSIIHNSHFEERWYYDSVNAQSVYFAKVVVDTTTIQYAWGVDSVTTGIRNVTAGYNSLSISPNPANNLINIQLPEGVNEPTSLKVTSMLGQEVYAEKIQNPASYTKQLNTANWQSGVYLIVVETPQQKYIAKLIKKD